MTATVPVPLQNISIDDRLQPRCDGLSEEHLTSLMETPEAWPPITLARSNGRLLLIDGFHRVEAATRLERDSITAVVHEPPEGCDLFAAAFQLNAKHGRPLTLRDRKAYASVLLQTHPDWSDRDIGRRTSLNHETVGALRYAEATPRPRRKPGTLPDDVDLFDPIRFRRNASKAQKAIAGYVARVTIALDDPYGEHSSLPTWPDDPHEIADACIRAMGAKRAGDTMSNLEAAARFLMQVTKAAKTLLKEVA
jgi:ParB-like nuclease family protein